MGSETDTTRRRSTFDDAPTRRDLAIHHGWRAWATRGACALLGVAAWLVQAQIHSL